MFILVTGGSGSGKSAFAEQQITRFAKPYFYLATMMPFGKETEQKIERHKKMRAGKGFETIESYFDVSDVFIEKNATVLLECMSNLTANVMFQEEKRKKEMVVEQILLQVHQLNQKVKNLIVVTNEVFSDGLLQYDSETQEYIDVLGQINQGLAKMADEIYEVVYGIGIQLNLR